MKTIVLKLRITLVAIVIIAAISNALAQPQGAVNGMFTVNSNGDQVWFSQGNLQYIGSASTPYWKFAENQWDYIGTTTGQNSGYQSSDRDLFGWGTSGYNHGAICYQPWSTSTTNTDYHAYGQAQYNLYDMSGDADWGYNPISNGGDYENYGWRTLTKDEWKYVFNTRVTTSGIRFAKARVNNVLGVILLPDNWDASYYLLESINNSEASFSANVISASQWATLEQHGAVFLPTAGRRVSGGLENVNVSGYYWSSSVLFQNTGTYVSSVYFVSFDSNSLHASPYTTGSGTIINATSRYCGFSVRLVASVQSFSYIINAEPNPSVGGTVTGSGNYTHGATVTLTATANEGYTFINWTENNEVVSTEAEYTFTVGGDRTLVANFEFANITFADANAKALCVANWDTNGDGELSYVEAAAVTDLGDVFAHNYYIVTFDELQYFTGLTTIGNSAFAWCHGLTSVVLPSTITAIGNQAFYDCRNLLSITIPAAVSSIDSSALSCENMETIVVEEGNTIYDSRDNCNAVIITSSNELLRGCKNTVIPNTVISLGVKAFASCAIESISIPASVVSISNTTFYACENIETITVDANNIVYDSRNNCNAIIETSTNQLVAGSKTTVIPNTVTSIGEKAFSYRFRWGSYEITIPESVTSIGASAYLGGYGIVSFSVLAEVPPTLGNNVFEYVYKDIPVYVPCGTRSAYQAAEGWSEFTNITVDPECGRQITASVNPANTGSVTGAGSYDVGDICTLTATPESGYRFVNWTENNEVVSTNATYQFTVNANKDLVANFEEYVVTNHWTPESANYADNMALNGVIFIDGVEQSSDQLEVGVFCGDECRGSAIAGEFFITNRYILMLTVYGNVGDQLTFKLYDHAIGEELDLTSPAAIVFDLDGYGSPIEPYILNFTLPIQTQTTSLVSGWNWYSTYIEQNGVGGLAMLENSLGTNGLRIQGRNSYVEQFEYQGSYYWYGTLNSVTNEQMYKVRTNAVCNAVMEGYITSSTDHPITINMGWNWIGYPINQSINVENALNGFTPEADDVIKGRNGYATYIVYGTTSLWYGTLNTLEPGKGYMYKSNSTTAKSLVFQTGAKADAVANITPENNIFVPNDTEFADNMLVTAVINIKGEELRSEEYELAAFVNDECRGSVKLMYVEPIDRYVAFLLVFGEEAESISFVLTDGSETRMSDNRMVYTSDAIIGTLGEPATLHFGYTGIDNNNAMSVQVYPNPTKDVLNVNCEGLRKVEVINAFGQVVTVKEANGDNIRIDLGDNAAGAYMVRIFTENGLINRQIVKN